jgi:hypothetical protein
MEPQDSADTVPAENLDPFAGWVTDFGYNAMVRFAAGEIAAGLSSPEHACEKHELVLPWILDWPLHDHLRANTAFAALRARVGFPA